MNEITLSAVGDICLGDSPKSLGFGVKSQIKIKGEAFIFEKIKAHLNSDIIFGNLEVVLSDKNLIKNDFDSEILRGSPRSIKALASAGFNVINISNNHIMQHGAEAFDETVDVLKQHNISVIGRSSNEEDDIRNIGGAKIGFLGYCFETDNYSPKNEVKYQCCTSLDKISREIKALKKKVDWVVVSAHWGLEFMDRPSLSTIFLGRNIVDAGANIVLGHHPHWIQGIEEYNNGIICYSLGNFVFDMPYSTKCQESLIVKFCLKPDQAISYKLIPVNINIDFQPELISKSHLKQWHNKFNNLKTNIPSPKTCLDYERCNLSYYKEYKSNIFKISLVSNLYFVYRILKTPRRLMNGKLKHLLKKILPVLGR